MTFFSDEHLEDCFVLSLDASLAVAMSEVDQDQVDPAMEMETAGTEVTETASNLNYWSGLLVQVR